MKKYFKNYLIIWLIVLTAFNAVAFLIPAATGTEKYTASFWIAYALITLGLIGQLYCTYRAFSKGTTKERMFLNLPLITISRSGLIVLAIVGLLFMLVPKLPGWIAAVVSIIVTAFYAIAVAKAETAAGIVEETGKKTKEKTQQIKLMIVEAEAILVKAKSETIKAECRKVYEALRYADPVSSEVLDDIEAELENKLEVFGELTEKADEKEIQSAAEEFIQLINKRNSQCKTLK